MNSFQMIGSMQLLAHEGQQQIARAIARGVGRAALRVLDLLGRNLPAGVNRPW